MNETYPTGRTINNFYDSVGRLAQVSGTLNGQQKYYLNGLGFWPSNLPYYMAYSNNIVPVYQYNSRLQTSSYYTTIGNDGNHFLEYSSLNWGSTNNNGTLQQYSQLYGNNVPGIR